MSDRELLEKKIEEGREMMTEEISKLASRRFLDECTACGGNWVAMMWSGFKRVHELGWISDEEFETFDKGSDELNKKYDGGIMMYTYLCEMAISVTTRQILRELEKEEA
jgi:hypothetical protein